MKIYTKHCMRAINYTTKTNILICSSINSFHIRYTYTFHSNFDLILHHFHCHKTIPIDILINNFTYLRYTLTFSFNFSQTQITFPHIFPTSTTTSTRNSIKFINFTIDPNTTGSPDRTPRLYYTQGSPLFAGSTGVP